MTLRPALALSALLALSAPGCGARKSDCADFPASVGFQPLEPLGGEPVPPGTPAWPAVPPDLATRAISVTSYPTLSHAIAHGRGIVRAPIARVYAALHEPATSRIHSPGDLWTPTAGVEAGFPVSFRIHYVVHDLVTVEWDQVYRGGISQGTPADPVQVELRYQKTCGTRYIAEQSGSLVATRQACDPVGAPLVLDCTALELVGWLNATQKNTDTLVAGTLNDMYDNLVAWLQANS